MSRRIEVELTSSRPDGSWTWRAAGARQPKGDLDGSLLYPGAKVGDVVRAEADFEIEGIVITAVLPPKGARAEPERLQILGPPRRDEPGVTTVLAPKSGRRRRDDWDGGSGDRGRRDRDRGERGRREAGPGGRPGAGPGGARGGPRGDRGDRGTSREGGRPGDSRARGSRPPRTSRPPVETRPKPKRLKAGRTHRQALLNALPETHRPIADLLLRDGIPGVRQAVERQNARLKADGKPEIRPDPLLDIAERLMPAIRSAEWRDKAEAAVAAGDDVDIKDLRSVVAAADAAARDDESRQLAQQLREAVAARADREHQAWLHDIDESLREGRLVRALRASSRPPKAGVPFPAELSHRLAEATTAGLTADITPDRFVTLVEALAVSPVRLQVEATSVPAEPAPEILAAVKRWATKVPRLAAQFGIDASAASAPKPRPLPPKPIPPAPAAPATSAPAPESPAAPEADTPAATD